jgi:hypothetical protein
MIMVCGWPQAKTRETTLKISKARKEKALSSNPVKHIYIYVYI